LKKKQYQNRAGVLGRLKVKKTTASPGDLSPKPCSGTFGSWLHAFLGKTEASPKVKSSGKMGTLVQMQLHPIPPK